MKKLMTTIGLTVLTLTVWAQGPNNSGTYYQAANGKQGAALKTALCEIIYNHTERTYGDLWTDFQTTDVRDDGKVWDMYSGISNFTFVTDQDRGSGGNKEGEYYNREHSFPNSWFGGKIQPMYTDLHHMYPTDKLVNNKRGNNPFGETEGETFTSANGFSKLGRCTYPGYSGIVFEPNDEYKGDFARTYFYMATCYEEKLPDWYASYADVKPTLDGNKYPGLSSWQLEMLMKWSAADPVSEKETNRNNAVYDIQHNRNPFIDYPGLEQLIWGDKTDVAFNYEEDASGIRQTNATLVDNDSWYSIDGRRLQGPPTRKGVYLNRGRKVVVNF
ncbi:MAG: endonuclease [Prevotella sp.]|nr:endonuclease [Prevotella sp.]